MSIFYQLERFVRNTFKTTVAIFLEALKLSPNAQGYVSGSITELLLKQHIENQGYEVERIREKWEGSKHPNHRGDFYFSKTGTDRWFVLESKGIKSNSEKWHKLFNRNNLIQFLYDYHGIIHWIDQDKDIENQIITWVDTNLPLFRDKYGATLYEYEEAQKYLQNRPKRETDKSRAIDALKNCSRDDIGTMISERLEYVSSKLGVLETHFVSGTSGRSGRTQATPRKDEFNVMSVDIFLRYPEHRFLFANPQLLDSSNDDLSHMKQNYIMGFVFVGEDGSFQLNLSEEWFDDFEEVTASLDPSSAINPEDKQVDNRNVVYEDE